MVATTPISAAVLAGGRSQRMGEDKALLALRPGDPPLAQLVLDRAAVVSNDRFLVASDRPEYAAFGVPVHSDRFPGTGTLGGIATALTHAAHEHCLVVACDMPFLNRDLLRWMVEQPRDYDVLIPRTRGESRQGRGSVLQTLHAIYHRRCLPAIERHLAAERRQVIGFFEDVEVRIIDEESVRAFDQALLTFFNANSPAAADEARRLLDAGEAQPSQI